MREQDQHIDQYFVAGTFQFEIFEENVDTEDLECFINDVLPVDWLERLISGSVEFGLEGDEGKPAGGPSFPFVEAWVQGLNAYIRTIFSIVVNI